MLFFETGHRGVPGNRLYQGHRAYPDLGIPATRVSWGCGYTRNTVHGGISASIFRFGPFRRAACVNLGSDAPKTQQNLIPSESSIFGRFPAKLGPETHLNASGAQGGVGYA